MADRPDQRLTLPGGERVIVAARQTVESAEYVNAAMPLAWGVWFIVAPLLGSSPAYGALSNLPRAFWLAVCGALGAVQYLSLLFGGRRVRRHAAGLAAAFWLFVLAEIVRVLPGSFLAPTLAVNVARCVWLYIRMRDRDV